MLFTTWTDWKLTLPVQAVTEFGRLSVAVLPKVEIRVPLPDVRLLVNDLTAEKNFVSHTSGRQ